MKCQRQESSTVTSAEALADSRPSGELDQASNAVRMPGREDIFLLTAEPIVPSRMTHAWSTTVGAPTARSAVQVAACCSWGNRESAFAYSQAN